MILDKGICSIFHRADGSTAGSMPSYTYTHLFSGWYGELNYETSPVWQTEGRKDQKVDARIRILQCRSIAENDVVVFSEFYSWKDKPAGALAYKVVRAWHGMDDESPTPISDLTLEVVTP